MVLVKSRSGLSRSGPSNPNPSKGHSTTLTVWGTVGGAGMRAAAEIATHHAGEIATAAAEVAGLGLEGLIDGPTPG